MKAAIIQHPLEHALPEAFLGYSKFVILHRAIPDVRDGLKPVHRRIIYSMNELNMAHDKAYSKSARLVGDCMGKYHPHGDSSIYDAAVRMVQPWATRYPMADGHGNFGSIDGDNSAAMRYCVTGDTLINTNRGLIPISDLVPNSKGNSDNELDTIIESVYKEKHHASKLFNSGVHDIIQIQTKFAYKIKGTYNHPILILRKDADGLPSLSWSLLKDVKMGDFVVINRSKAQIESEVDLATEDEALVLGAMVSEGYYYTKSYKLAFSNSNLQFVSDVEAAFKNINPGLKFYRRKTVLNGHPFAEVDIHNKEYFKSFIEKYNFAKGSANQIVPNCILRSSKKIQRIFLRYLFEGDGCPVRYKQGNFGVSYSSSSLKLLEQIQIMLLQFGVVSSIKGDGDKKYRLIISGIRNLKIFKDEINFAYKTKRERLESLFEECDIARDHTMTDRVPFISEYIRNKYHSDWLKRTNFDRLGNFYVHAEKIKKIVDSLDFTLMSEIFTSGYIYLPVENIALGDPETVYSIKVDSDYHSFTANGFINHNTEIRMTPLSEIMCQDIDKNTVSFVPNYDQRLKEPSVLPSPLPNILLNGTSGIAVGMASNMPPHNLKEVINGIIAQLNNPNISLDELMNLIPGPDFPTGGKIIGLDGIREAYETGRGKITMRGAATLERGKGGRTLIVITEIPYQVNKATLAAKIESLAEEKIEGISDVRDESDREGMRLVVECHKDTNPQIVLQHLYKYTQLQETFGVINLVINYKGSPVVMGLKAIIAAFIEHRQIVIRRRTEYELKKAKARAHILEALVVAINNLDEVIQIIRSAKNSSIAKANLVVRFDFDDAQVQAILDMKLQHLTGLELESIRKEYEKLLLMIDDFTDILKNAHRIDSILKNELLGLSSRYADNRRTVILAKEDTEDIIKEDRICYFFRDGHFQWTEAKKPIDQILVPEDTNGLNFLFVTRNGQVMRSPVDDFLRARTNETITLINGDELIRTFLVGDAGEVMLISRAGQCIRFKVDEVSIMGRKSRGVRGMNTDNVLTVLYIGETDAEKRLVTVTDKGYTKQTSLAEYPLQGRGGKGLAVAKIDDKTGPLIEAVLSDGTGKYKKVPLEGRAKMGQVIEK